MSEDELPFSKKKQGKKPKKREDKGLTRKEERKIEKIRKYNEVDSTIYQLILERSWDWNQQYHRCELCKEAEGAQMHHVKHRSLGGDTSLENVLYVCLSCHMKKGHGI